MNKKHIPIIFVLALAAASLACSIFVGGPEYPDQPVPVSESEKQSMQEQVAKALEAGAETGIITIQFTESQLTSFLALQLTRQEDPPFSDPIVLLRNNQMQVYGKIKSGIFTANMLINMNLGIDPATGMPSITVASADLGPIPAPEGLNNALNAIIAEAFTGSFGPVATGIRIESITTADGIMTLTGRIK